MKITMFLAAIYLTSTSLTAWAGEEYCGQLAYIREGSVSQKGYYLKTKEFSAHLLNIKPNSETDQYLKQLLKKQLQEIGVCITGVLGGEESNPIQNGIRVITDVTAARNYNNGNLPDSLSMLKLSIVYEGVWDVLPRVGDLNIYAHPTSGKITNVTLSIWEPTQNSPEDRTLETITIDELLNGEIIAMTGGTVAHAGLIVALAARLGRFYGLVHCAGVVQTLPLTASTPEQNEYGPMSAKAVRPMSASASGRLFATGTTAMRMSAPASSTSETTTIGP